MTKEKLEKEVTEYLNTQTLPRIDSLVYRVIKNLILGFAEPREKQIQIDAEQIRALQKQNGELTDRVKELEAQIEKMKCCENCAWWYKLPNGQRDCAETCENRDNWSLRR